MEQPVILIGHEGAAYASVYAASKHAVEGLTQSDALSQFLSEGHASA